MLFKGQQLGKYKIVAPLGSGGFGTVYLANDTWIDKRVAIKVPHRQNLDFGELLREPRLLASVSHPNIVAVTTAEKQDGIFFIVMEYVPGETLENIIATRGALDLTRALDFTCQICNAVDHAHRQGVIHRDLRPANVLVGEHDMLKVADFGTSRFLEIAAHGTTVIGSPPYMAPEQFHGKAVFASDLYSLGITMYQMLTGVAALRHTGAGGSRQADVGGIGLAAAPAQSCHSEGHQRHRDEGDGAGDRPPAISAPRICSKTCWRRAPPRGPRRRRACHGHWPAADGQAETMCRASRRGCVRAKRRVPASAGTAASRCTRGPTAVRSVMRNSDGKAIRDWPLTGRIAMLRFPQE